MNNSNNNIINIHKKKILVLSAGGNLGIAMLGALHYIDQLGYIDNFTTFIGSSVGAIISFLLCIGYKPLEIYKIVKNLDLNKMYNISILKFIKKFGFCDSSEIDNVCIDLLKKKNINQNITFKQLKKFSGKSLYICTVNVNQQKYCFFSYKTSPDMKILDALKMSYSIPFIFTPVLFNNEYYIDGGCLLYYPIILSKKNLDKTFGIFLYSKRIPISHISSIQQYIQNLYSLFYYIIQHNKVNHNYNQITLKISFSKNINLFSFNPSKLFNIGYICAQKNIINVYPFSSDSLSIL